MPVERPVSAGEPMALGALPVTVIPPPGARLDASKTSPSNDTVQFLVGDVTYWLHARRWSGSLDEFTTKSATSAAPGRAFSGWRTSATSQPSRECPAVALATP